MSQTAYMLSLVAVTAGVSILLRAFPFILFGSAKKTPDSIRYIGKVLSPAAIAMLLFPGSSSADPLVRYCGTSCRRHGRRTSALGTESASVDHRRNRRLHAPCPEHDPDSLGNIFFRLSGRKEKFFVFLCEKRGKKVENRRK